VLLGRLGSTATAVVSVAGRTPALLPTRENNVMLLLEGPGGGAAVYQVEAEASQRCMTCNMTCNMK
jgi:hypothetical protein